MRRAPLLALGLLLGFLASTSTLAKTIYIHQLKFIGAERSSEKWLQEYLDLHCPCQLNEIQIKRIEEKLLTSQVFVSAKAFVEVTETKKLQLVIKLEEKWTTIPVIRGAFGGGTPLLVAGIYDTHSLGRLWTFGGELRKYGNAPPGGVIWARAPRWLNGDYYLNLELWQDNRLRTLYDKKTFDELGTVDSRATMVRGEFRFPFGIPNTSIGLRLSTRAQDPSQLIDTQSIGLVSSQGLSVNQAANTLNKGQLRIVYDDILVNQINMDGLRLIASGGPIHYEQKVEQFWQLELFYYLLPNNRWNIAFHSLLSSASDSSFQSQKFLGGFDSIRGIPDGGLYGRTASYSNLEIRHLSLALSRIHLQTVAFVDSGFATNAREWREEPWTSTAGIGLRIAIPQVHRLMLRMDYAWNLGDNPSHGFTIGMNQFFQPYRPL